MRAEGSTAAGDRRGRADAAFRGYRRPMSDIPDDERVERRAELLPEELVVGSDDPDAQARAILEESDQRIADPEQTRRESTQTPDPRADDPQTGAETPDT
jgi:hypothetical protein